MAWWMLVTAGLLFTSAVAQAQTAVSRPEVWMMPPGCCFKEMFTQPDGWKETRAMVDVIGCADHWLNKTFTDDELRAWLPMIGKWGLKLGLEVGAVKPWGPTSQKTFDIQRKAWDRFQSLGGRIYAIAMDEPLVCCRAHIKKPDDYAVEETAQFIALVRKNYPDIRIGDIEGYPFIPLGDQIAWIDALQARLAQMNVRGMDFYRVDVDWVHFIMGNSNWRELKKLEDACRARRLPFSLIYWAADYPALQKRGLVDDATWYTAIMSQGYDYALVNGSPDQVVIESWVGAPSRCVPETDEWTFTRSVRDFCARFVKAKR